MKKKNNKNLMKQFFNKHWKRKECLIEWILKGKGKNKNGQL